MSADPFTGWAICELMGRRRIAGHVTADAPLMQATRLRVDIYPGDAEQPAATQYVSFPVYALTPCTEALARKVGLDTIRYSMPVAQWELATAEPPAIGPGDTDYVDIDILVDADIDADIDDDDDEPWSHGGDDDD